MSLAIGKRAFALAANLTYRSAVLALVMLRIIGLCLTLPNIIVTEAKIGPFPPRCWIDR